MSLERRAAAHEFKKWIVPGLSVYAWVTITYVASIIAEPTSAAGVLIGSAIWAWLFRNDYKRLKEVLDDEDFFKKTKSKAKRWLRNTFAVRKLASSKVGG